MAFPLPMYYIIIPAVLYKHTNDDFSDDFPKIFEHLSINGEDFRGRTDDVSIIQ